MVVDLQIDPAGKGLSFHPHSLARPGGSVTGHRDIAAGWRDVGGPCGSLPTAPERSPETRAESRGS
jgi:hypothetical protein